MLFLSYLAFISIFRVQKNWFAPKIPTEYNYPNFISAMLMYSWFPNLSHISMKNSFGKVVFQIFTEIEMTRNENRLFGNHFETVKNIFFTGIWLWLEYI